MNRGPPVAVEVRFARLLYPTRIERSFMVVWWSERQFAPQHDSLLLDHLVGAGEQRGGTASPSALAVLRLISEIILGRRLHRQVGGLLALEDAIDVSRRAPVLVDEIEPIGDQSAGCDKVPVGVDRGQLVPGRQRNDQIAMNRPITTLLS